MSSESTCSRDARALHIINEECVGTYNPQQYTLTIMLSIMVHSALLLALADPRIDITGITDREPTNSKLSVSFQRPAPPPAIQPPPKPKPRLKPTLKPLPKPKPKPEVKPIPTPVRPEVAKSPDAGQAIMASDARRQELQNYLSQVMAKIERNKHYPRMARRRSIEGIIQISFTLLDDGSINNMRLHGGHKLLSSAVRRAIKKSTPLPPPPSNLTTPYGVSFTMRFQLH